MEAYTVYEVTRRSDSEYPTFAALQIEEEEVIEQVEVDADHSDCEVFYCETCKAAFGYNEIETFIVEQFEHHGHRHGLCPLTENHVENDEGRDFRELCPEGHEERHQYDSADVIRVKIPGCGAQFEQALNGRDEVVEYKEVERNWFNAYVYDELSKTPIVNRDGRWLQLFCVYSALPREAPFEPMALEELGAIISKVAGGYVDGSTEWGRQAQDTDEAGARWAARRCELGAFVFAAQDEDGYYFAVEVSYRD